MGRYINCEVNGESNEVYKYAFGDQPSEMYRISTELGIGEYHLIKYAYNDEDEEYDEAPTIEYIDEQSEEVEGDILILVRSDIEKLNEQIKILQTELEVNKSTEQVDNSYHKNDELYEHDELYEYEDDNFYIAMIIAIRDFMNKYPLEDKFTFIGEF